jgi:lipoyl(octanoyl) transferase
MLRPQKEESSGVKNCLTIDLGLIGYAEAYALQGRIVAARKAEAIGDVLLLCEHLPVITQGRNGKREHLLVSESVLRQRNVEFHETSRGGDVTYHGPGQLVGYPILQLGAIRKDVVWFVRMLEEVMLRTSAEFGICAVREAGKTGIWVREQGREFSQEAPGAQSSPSEEGSGAEKLGAIGVHLSRWVTSHGFAYNVSTDLRNFDLIVPCGIAGRKATSLEKLLGHAVQLSAVGPKIASHFGEVFGLEMKAGSREEFFKKLELAERLVAVPA